MSRKMNETLTDSEYESLYAGDSVGIFNYVIKDSDEFVSVRKNLCLAYYTSHSALKTISPCYELLLSKANKTVADERLSDIIRGKFLRKWNRLYTALNLDYGVLEGYEEQRDITEQKSDNGLTSNTTTSDGKNGTKTTTNSSGTVADDVYGFNSEEAVHKGKSTTSDNQTVTEDKEDNTSHNTEVFSGSNINTSNGSKNETVKGRNDTAQKLINEEIRLRNLTNFIDIVCADIDSVATIQIYF